MRRAAAWGDKHDSPVAEQLAQFDDDRVESMEVLEELWDVLAAVVVELSSL
jgi:hypothetical protein